MTITSRLIVSIGTLAGMAAGYRILSKWAHRNPSGLPEAQLTEEERAHTTAVFQAMQKNSTEAPFAG